MSLPMNEPEAAKWISQFKVGDLPAISERLREAAADETNDDWTREYMERLAARVDEEFVARAS